MKQKLFTLLLALGACTSIFANVQSGQIGPTATWNYDTETHEFRISGTGETYDGSCYYDQFLIGSDDVMLQHYPLFPMGTILLYGASYTFNKNDVKSVVVEEGITKLGEWTCAEFFNVQTVTLPQSLRVLGGGAFVGDTCLTEITIPVNVDSMQTATCKQKKPMYGDGDHSYGAFSGCTNLKTVYWNAHGSDNIIRPLYGLGNVLTNLVLGNTVEYIPEKFCNNFKLLSGELILSKNIRNIGYRAFAGCTGITKISVLADSISTPPTLFQNDYYTPSQYFNYQGSPFIDCGSNLEIVIGKDVKYIGPFLFSKYYQQGKMIGRNVTYNTYNAGSMDIQNITFETGSSLRVIDFYAFAGAEGLRAISLPESLWDIGVYAFYNTDLTEIVIPEEILSIGANAFESCESLSTIKYNATYGTVAGAETSDGVSYQSPFISCADSITIFIGKEVREIPEFLFMGGQYSGKVLQNGDWVYTPSVTARTDIRNVIIEEGSKLGNIGSYAFAGCSNISTMTIPEKVYLIEDYAFSRCSGIDTFFVHGNNPATLGTSVFPSKAKMKVNCAAREQYMSNTQWSAYNITTECMGEIPATYYTIRFLNWNGAVLQTVQVLEGEMPVFTGATPTKPEDEQYTYAFNGWSPTIVPATADTYYYAQYTATEKPIEPSAITVRLDPTSATAWNNVYLFAWNSNGEALTGNWPGTKVTQDANGWWAYTFPEEVQSVNIIWNSGNGNQTMDIMNVTSSDCFALESTSGTQLNVILVDCSTVFPHLTYYTIRFLNYDGTELQSSQVLEGEMPVYSGATPVRPEEENYTYTFNGWNPTIVAATANADYIAQYTAIEKTVAHTIPTAVDLTQAGYDVVNNVVLCLQFTGEATICYDIVLAGNYNNWNTTPANMLKMQPLAGFEGWYAAEFPYRTTTDDQGNIVYPQAKPVQLKSDGSFSWDCQSGDVGAWTLQGGKEAYVVQGFNNEADVYYPVAGAYIYGISYWKNHYTPCVVVPKHNYTIHLYAPNACAEMKPAILGSFNNWETGISMTEQTDVNQRTYYTYTVYAEEGKEYKFREASSTDWSNELYQYYEEYSLWAPVSNFVLPVTAQDITIVHDFSDNSQYRFHLCEGIDTAIEVVDAGDSVLSDMPQKILVDGQIYILRGGKAYTVTGQEVR